MDAWIGTERLPVGSSTVKRDMTEQEAPLRSSPFRHVMRGEGSGTDPV